MKTLPTPKTKTQKSFALFHLSKQPIKYCMSKEKDTPSMETSKDGIGGNVNENGEGVKNSYLQLREAKMARNRDKLSKLGLAGAFHDSNIDAANTKNVSKASSDRKNASGGGGSNGAVVTRRSTRLRKRSSPPSPSSEDPSSEGQTKESTKGTISAGTDTVLSKLPVPKRNRIATSKPTTVSEPKPGTTRATNVNIRHVLYATFDYPIFVGRRLSKTGKAAVVEHANFMCGNGSGISFNKYSGVCEFRNDVLFLWVNIDAPDADVRNEFLNDGKQIVWWGGSRMHDGSPVIQRLINIGKKCASSDNSDQDDMGIVLWCRMYNKNKRTFDPYSCMGRLGYHSHDVGSQPLRFVFDLLDYGHLQNASEPDGANHYGTIVRASTFI